MKEKPDAPLTVQSPAKINLFLKVTGKRADGYHELLSLMSPVSLYDTLTLSRNESSEISVECTHPAVPADKRNIAARAATMFFKELRLSDTVHIRIEKRIPVGAGLGGGSGNAAAVLLALNQQYGSPFDTQALIRMGVRIGADVPFFIFNRIFSRPALASGIGEVLEPINNIEPYHVLLVSWPYTVSTAWVFGNFNLELTKPEKLFIQSFFDNKRFHPDHHLVNDLEAVTAAAYPEIHAAKQALMDQGAAGALMTGSGPTVFGLFSDLKIAEKARNALERSDLPAAKIYLAQLT